MDQHNQELFSNAPFDQLTFGSIDFKKNNFDFKAYQKIDNKIIETHQDNFFDLASITKVLTNGLCYLIKPEIFSLEVVLALNHRAGIPSWGILPNPGWEKIILSYKIQKSQTLYSDYSALRVMLEFNQKSPESMKEICRKFWDKDCINWLDSNGEFIVHDPNAFNLKTFCSHAGCFSNFSGLARLIIKMNEKHDLLNKMKKQMTDDTSNRFVGGWDRVEDLENTSAGRGCSKFTFGHLGFTGTSVWIDIERQKGFVILSNATQKYWYAKKEIIQLRKNLGTQFWAQA